MERVSVGTTGWAGLHPKEYSRRYDVVEFNWTFHERDGTPEQFRRVAAELKELKLLAVLKVSGVATHENRLRSPQEWWPALWARYSELHKAGVLGGLLWQLPPSYRCSARTLQELEALAPWLPRDVAHAFEFRHSSWHGSPPALACLRRHRFCLAWIHTANEDGWCGDLASGWASQDRTCPSLYLRLFGTKSKAVGRYSEQFLREQLVPQLRGANGPQEAFVVFAQADVPEHMKADASSLVELLGGRERPEAARSTRWERDALAASLGLAVGTAVEGVVQRISHRAIFVDIGRCCKATLDVNHARRQGLLDSLRVGMSLQGLVVEDLEFQGEWGHVSLTAYSAAIGALGSDALTASEAAKRDPATALDDPEVIFRDNMAAAAAKSRRWKASAAVAAAAKAPPPPPPPLCETAKRELAALPDDPEVRLAGEAGDASAAQAQQERGLQDAQPEGEGAVSRRGKRWCGKPLEAPEGSGAPSEVEPASDGAPDAGRHLASGRPGDRAPSAGAEDVEESRGAAGSQERAAERAEGGASRADETPEGGRQRLLRQLLAEDDALPAPEAPAQVAPAGASEGGALWRGAWRWWKGAQASGDPAWPDAGAAAGGAGCPGQGQRRADLAAAPEPRAVASGWAPTLRRRVAARLRAVPLFSPSAEAGGTGQQDAGSSAKDPGKALAVVQAWAMPSTQDPEDMQVIASGVQTMILDRDHEKDQEEEKDHEEDQESNEEQAEDEEDLEENPEGAAAAAACHAGSLEVAAGEEQQEASDEDAYFAFCDRCGAVHVVDVDVMSLGIEFSCADVGASCDDDAPGTSASGDMGLASGGDLPVGPSPLGHLSAEEKRALVQRHIVQRQAERLRPQDVQHGLAQLFRAQMPKERYRDNQVVTHKGERFIKINRSLDPGPGCELGGILVPVALVRQQDNAVPASLRQHGHAVFVRLQATGSGGYKSGYTFENKWSQHTAETSQRAAPRKLGQSNIMIHPSDIQLSGRMVRGGHAEGEGAACNQSEDQLGVGDGEGDEEQESEDKFKEIYGYAEGGGAIRKATCDTAVKEANAAEEADGVVDTKEQLREAKAAKAMARVKWAAALSKARARPKAEEVAAAKVKAEVHKLQAKCKGCLADGFQHAGELDVQMAARLRGSKNGMQKQLQAANEDRKRVRGALRVVVCRVVRSRVAVLGGFTSEAGHADMGKAVGHEAWRRIEVAVEVASRKGWRYGEVRQHIKEWAEEIHLGKGVEEARGEDTMEGSEASVGCVGLGDGDQVLVGRMPCRRLATLPLEAILPLLILEFLALALLVLRKAAAGAPAAVVVETTEVDVAAAGAAAGSAGTGLALVQVAGAAGVADADDDSMSDDAWADGLRRSAPGAVPSGGADARAGALAAPAAPCEPVSAAAGAAAAAGGEESLVRILVLASVELSLSRSSAWYAYYVCLDCIIGTDRSSSLKVLATPRERTAAWGSFSAAAATARCISSMPFVRPATYWCHPTAAAVGSLCAVVAAIAAIRRGVSPQARGRTPPVGLSSGGKRPARRRRRRRGRRRGASDRHFSEEGGRAAGHGRGPAAAAAARPASPSTRSVLGGGTMQARTFARASGSAASPSTLPAEIPPARHVGCQKVAPALRAPEVPLRRPAGMQPRNQSSPSRSLLPPASQARGEARIAELSWAFRHEETQLVGFDGNLEDHDNSSAVDWHSKVTKAMGQLLASVAARFGGEEPIRSLPNTVWMAPVLNPGGFSSEALAYAPALQAAFARQEGAPSFGMRQFAEQPDYQFVLGLPNGTKETVQSLLTMGQGVGQWDVAVCHATPDVWLEDGAFGWGSVEPCPPLNTRFSIGRAMYETDRLPEAWVPRINAMDAVWVPSAFAVEQFASSGVERRKIVVIPEAVDTAFFDPSLHAPLKSKGMGSSSSSGKQRYRFLSVFKWEARKGWDVLLSAYFQEFSKDDPVVLYIKTQAFHTSEDFKDEIGRFVKGMGAKARRPLARYKLIAQDLPLAELPRLYRSADALVQPSRGEGANPPQAMAMGLPVIATNWSGTTEFLRDGSSLPLRIDGLREVAKGNGPEGHRWAQPSTSHLRSLMRWCAEHPSEARAVGSRAREEMVKHFSPEVVARLHLLPQLARIASQLETTAAVAEQPTMLRAASLRETL
ncbi:unnamed protein product [Prorocentrum cordatum]|uniref:S1 motif domain-containing protein n=1 Tax=Prorocentrum cordatum TaxID=2364126 RepID=A0ABN9P989_9DINO|nr:unnamed protein product [Polarella glacialis]